MRRPAIALLLLVAVMLLAGCGEDATSDGPRPLSKRAYIERSNELQSDAASVFSSLDGRVAATPAQATRYLQAFDRLITGLESLTPPREWRDEHEDMLEAVRAMRQSMAIVSKASPKNQRVIALQLERSGQAQRDYERAVREINATR
jgi:hypothetical protein